MYIYEGVHLTTPSQEEILIKAHHRMNMYLYMYTLMIILLYYSN